MIVYGYRIKWTTSWRHNYYSVVECWDFDQDDVAIEAVNQAKLNGWTPPKWWQWWRWSDTVVPERYQNGYRHDESGFEQWWADHGIHILQ